MIDTYHDVDKLVEQYRKYGELQINTQEGIVRIVPYVENRVEVTLDSSVPADTPLEDVPPHLKQVLDLYFVNSDAIYPSKNMIRCTAPGKLQAYQGKVWVDIPPRQEWAEWETYVEEMENIHYPFIVLPSDNFVERSFMLVPKTKMDNFLTLLNEPNRQVLLHEFEDRWVYLFHPEAENNEAYPLGAWLHVAETPNAYVDVVTPNDDGTVNVIFTVPPLMSLNQGRSSVATDDIEVDISTMISRCTSESKVIPKSGNQRFIEAMSDALVESTTIDKHIAMWDKIYERYGWKNTEVADSVTNENKVSKNDPEEDPFKMASIDF